MSKRIDSEEEYERRLVLLQKHEDKEAEGLTRSLVGGLVDVTGVGDKLGALASSAIKRETS